MLPEGLALTGFDPERDTDELVRLWRESFEWGVGVTDPHPLSEQRAYLLDSVVPSQTLSLVRNDSGVVAFMATTPTWIHHLYVRVDHVGRGLGSWLVDHAKACSAGTLDLYTFARNSNARAFYARHGFREVAEGFEEQWQLPDLLLRWTAEGKPLLLRPAPNGDNPPTATLPANPAPSRSADQRPGPLSINPVTEMGPDAGMAGRAPGAEPTR